jgi:amidophosphoribosyltransferase
MYHCKFALSTRSVDELVARRAINALEGRRTDDITEYLDDTSKKYRRMVDWIAREINVTTLKYQKIDDMIEAIGLPREKLCLHCWIGEGNPACCAR